MATRPWRGTLLYVGAAAAMTAAGVAKFAPAVQDSSAGATTAQGSSTGSSSADTATSSGSSDSSVTDPGSSTGGDTTTSDTVTIVGAVEQTRYGPVQVSVTFTGSQIADVQALQVPSRERESVRINEQAVPLLQQKVVAAQSAQVDTVSGATYTSEAYAESVQSAIDQHG